MNVCCVQVGGFGMALCGEFGFRSLRYSNVYVNGMYELATFESLRGSRSYEADRSMVIYDLDLVDHLRPLELSRHHANSRASTAEDWKLPDPKLTDANMTSAGAGCFLVGRFILQADRVVGARGLASESALV